VEAASDLQTKVGGSQLSGERQFFLVGRAERAVVGFRAGSALDASGRRRGE